MGDLDWTAIRELVALRDRFREVLERTLLPASLSVPPGAPSHTFPLDVWENETEVVVEAELPGASSEDIEVRLEGDTLILGGELRPTGDGGGSFLRIERYCGPFRRLVRLQVPVGGAPRATLRQGVLEVRLPKAGERRRHVRIEGSTGD
jgi:HSP20 family protein